MLSEIFNTANPSEISCLVDFLLDLIKIDINFLICKDLACQLFEMIIHVIGSPQKICSQTHKRLPNWSHSHYSNFRLTHLCWWGFQASHIPIYEERPPHIILSYKKHTMQQNQHFLCTLSSWPKIICTVLKTYLSCIIKSIMAKIKWVLLDTLFACFVLIW